MLDKDPFKRISLEDTLNHPWILKYRESKRQKEWGIFRENNDDYISDEDESLDRGKQSNEYTFEEDKTETSNPFNNDEELPK